MVFSTCKVLGTPKKLHHTIFLVSFVILILVVSQRLELLHHAIVSKKLSTASVIATYPSRYVAAVVSGTPMRLKLASSVVRMSPG